MERSIQGEKRATIRDARAGFIIFAFFDVLIGNRRDLIDCAVITGCSALETPGVFEAVIDQ